MAAEDLDLGTELPRLPDVIGVEERDELATRRIQARVASCGQSSVGFVEIADATILIRGHGLASVIRRAVVDQDYLKIPVRLREDAVDRLANNVCPVVTRYDNADKTRHAGISHEGLAVYQR